MPASKSNLREFNPDFIYRPENGIGTTQTPSGLITDVVLTEKLQFKDGSIVTGTSQDFRENQYDNCPSSFALFQGLSALDSNIKAIDPDNNFFRDNAVISLPLIDTGFSSPWEIEGNWTVVDAQAIYSSDSQLNALKIPVSAIPFVGYYYLHLIIDRLDSGAIKIYDHADTLVTTITTYGEYSVEMYIANADITTFRIVAEDVFPGDYINLSYVGFHRVTDRFRDYFMHILRTQGVTGGGGIDADAVKKMIELATSALSIYLSDLITNVDNSLLEHVNDRGNVHGMTLKEIGAAKFDHTHPEFDLVLGNLDSIYVHVNDRETNPHGITSGMIHASPDDHHHELADIGIQGAADAFHDHDDVYLKQTDRPGIITDASNIAQGLIETALSKFAGSVAKFEPFIVVPKETGIDVLGAEDSVITEPAIVVLTNYLLHQSDSDYDYDAGLASCSRTLIGDESAAKAFSDYFGLSALFQEETVTIQETVLAYRFHTEREISQYRVIKDLSNQIKGFAKKWQVYLDGILVAQVDDDTWVTLKKSTIADCYTGTLTPTKCREIKFVIREAIMDPTELNWAFRVIVNFSDCPDFPKFQFKLNHPFALGFDQISKIKITEALSATFDPPNAGESLYIFLKRGDDSTQGEHYTLQLDTVPSEFSQNYLGVDMLLDKYEGITNHPTWGSVSCSSVNPKFPENNLYSNENTHYQSQDGENEVSIVHTFPTPISGLRGYRIVFDKSIIEQKLVPDGIKVAVTTVETVDGIQISTESVTTQFTNYFPAIRKDSEFTWEIIKFPDDDSQPKNVKTVKITLTGTRGQTALAMSKFVMMFRSWQYNPYTGLSSNDQKCPLGRLDSIVLPDTSNVAAGVIHRGCPQAACIYYPVEHFNLLTSGTYKIPNIFGTSIVSTEVMTTDVAGGLESFASVVNVTDQDIYVEVINSGRYAVKVHRLW